jgi:CUB/sushi domain-containing protein
VCAIVTCSCPGEISNGKYIYNRNDYVSGPLNYATKIEAHCAEGYKRIGSMERLCTSNGNWSDVDPYCSIVQCNIRDLGHVANGYYVLNGNKEPNTSFATYMQTASVVCTTGFRSVSDSTATCTSEGVWSRKPAACNIVTCLAPMETAVVKYKIWHNTSYGSFVNAFPFGAFSEVICVKGILKTGSKVRHCKSDGLWDGDDAVCGIFCSCLV